MIFLTLLIIPVLVAIGFYIFGSRQITLGEFLAHIAVQLMVALVSVIVIYHINTTDIETWNGCVVEKKSERVHCRHSYPCHCHTYRCGKSSCMHCDTCYEHFYDIDWNVYSNIKKFNIDTIDRQGLREPPRWTVVNIGDPVSVNHSYENYLKGAANSLFRYQGSVSKYKDLIPKHPHDIYDYYKLNRAVCVNYCPQDIGMWNTELSKINGIVGYNKGVNIIVLFVSKVSHDYVYAIEQSWLGGKKNDSIVIISVDKNGVFNWVSIVAWSKNPLYQIKLRDDLLEVGKLDRQQVFKVIVQDTVKYYQRKSEKDFAYLKSSITPTTSQWCWAMVIGLVVSVVLGIIFYKNEVL